MSAPIVDTMVNLIQRGAHTYRQGPGGIHQPLFYKYQEMFSDVVKDAMTPGGLCDGKRFNATRGWDPVTGMVVPRYEKMLEVFLGLP